MNVPKYECEFKKDHYTAYYAHHILRIMCGFFNIPLNMQELWDGAYGLSSLSEKTRKSSSLQMSLQKQHGLLNSYFKTPSGGLTRVWTLDLLLGIPTLIQLS